MGAFIYSNKVNYRIVELENEYETERRRELFTAVICLAACALGVMGLLFRIGLF